MPNAAMLADHGPLCLSAQKARVIRMDAGHHHVLVALESKRSRIVPARMVYPLAGRIGIGDTVLVIGDERDELYILGALSPIRNQCGEVSRIILSDGTNASEEESESGRVLRVRSQSGELMFEYDPNAGKARITSGAKNLVMEVPAGSIELKAGDAIRLSSRRIELEGRSGHQTLPGFQVAERLRSVFSMMPGRIDMSGQNVKVTAGRGEFMAEESVGTVKKAVSRIGSLRLTVDRLETAANSIIERAKSVYRSTEGVTQLKSGRMRMIVEAAFHLKSRNSVIKAKDDVKVKGEKIHLG